MIVPRVLGAVFAVALLAGCADDGNDRAIGGWTSFPTASSVPDVGVRVDAESAVSGEDAGADGETTEVPSDTVPTVEPTGVVVPVIALDNTFRPEIVEISVGDEVLWENRGLNEHDVLHVEGDDWGIEVEDFQPGDVYSHVFTEPGEYRYYCSIHGNTEVGMVGTVVVTG